MICDWFAAIDWSATGSMIGGLSTSVVAVLTIRLIRENRLLRKAGDSPKVVAHFELHPDGNGGLNMALSNVGTGPAFDVSFSFEREAGDFENYKVIVDYAKERPAMTMIAQGEKVRFLFAMGFELFRPKDPSVGTQLKPFNVRVSWRASMGKELISEKYRLDVSAYAGLPGMLSKPPLIRIADDLSKINKHLATLSPHPSSSAGFVDTTPPEQGTRAGVRASPPATDEEAV